jgi:hypothetical protein
METMTMMAPSANCCHYPMTPMLSTLETEDGDNSNDAAGNQ